MNEHEERTYQHNHSQEHQYRSNHAGSGKRTALLPARAIHRRLLEAGARWTNCPALRFTGRQSRVRWFGILPMRRIILITSAASPGRWPWLALLLVPRRWRRFLPG